MKKLVSLVVILLCILSYGYGQQNPRGGNFESWKLNTKWHYYEPDSSFFSTLNALDSVGAGISVYRCDTAHGGNYSARLVTRIITYLDSVRIPGVIGTLKISWLTEKAILGIPYPYGTTLPTRFSGYYESYPLLGDSSGAVLLLSKWNSSTKHRDTLAYNRLVFRGTVDSWTKFDTPVNYIDQSTIPDTLTILYLSCAGFNALNFFGSQGQIGSMAMFDDVNLLGVNGFPLLLMPSVNVKISPNPASDNIKIQTGRNIENGYFEIYDAQARLIRQITMNGNSKQIGVSDLSAGTYYYKLIENSKLLNSGTFIVTR
jgi:hypothetical protein